jgi:hypothetical protein
VTRQVRDRGRQTIHVVPELTEAAMAVEAEHTTNQSRLVIVVDMLRSVASTDRALAALRANQVVDLRGTDAVSALQVVVA